MLQRIDAASIFPLRLVDLVFLRVSQINGCAYCIDTHYEAAPQCE